MNAATLTALLRPALVAFGGIFVARGYLSREENEQVAGALAILSGVGWELWESHQRRRAASAPPVPPAPEPPSVPPSRSLRD